MKKLLTILTLCAVAALGGCKKDNPKSEPEPVEPTVKITGVYELKVGEALSTLELTGTVTHDGQTVDGTLAWKSPTTTYDKAGEYDAEWVFTPEDATRYIVVEGKVKVAVGANAVTVEVTGTYELHTSDELSTLTLTGTATHDGQAVEGTFVWKDPAATYHKAGSADAEWVFTPTDAEKYLPTEGTVGINVLMSIYTCGNQNNGTVNVAKVWKNGEELYALTDGTSRANANSIAVSDGDVYVCGGEMNANGVNVAKVWKNGEELHALTDGNRNALAGAVVVSDGEVYVSGSESNGTVKVVKVWKNGEELYALTDGSWDADVSSLAVSGSDVYVSGYEINDKGNYVAKVWKNGEEWKALTDGNFMAIAMSVAVSGSDVYVCGFEMNDKGNSVAKVWKNGEVLYALTDGKRLAFANSIVFSDGDMHVGGHEGDEEDTSTIGRVWKNGTLHCTIEEDNQIQIYSIAVSGGDVYTGGFEVVGPGALSIGKVWRNDKALYTTEKGVEFWSIAIEE